MLDASPPVYLPICSGNIDVVAINHFPEAIDFLQTLSRPNSAVLPTSITASNNHRVDWERRRRCVSQPTSGILASTHPLSPSLVLIVPIIENPLSSPWTPTSKIDTSPHITHCSYPTQHWPSASFVTASAFGRASNGIEPFAPQSRMPLSTSSSPSSSNTCIPHTNQPRHRCPRKGKEGTKTSEEKSFASLIVIVCTLSSHHDRVRYNPFERKLPTLKSRPRGKKDTTTAILCPIYALVLDKHCDPRRPY